jgi:hypothetical protein
MRGLPGGEKIDEQLWRTLTKNDHESAFVAYTITEIDTAGPFIEKVPADFHEKASLARLSYTGVQEALAEKFHMSETLLRLLNPNVTLESAGTEIVVPNVQRDELPRGSLSLKSAPVSSECGPTTRKATSSRCIRRPWEAASDLRRKGAQSHCSSRESDVSLRPGLEFERGKCAGEARASTRA